MEPLSIHKPIKFVRNKAPVTNLRFDIDSQRYTSDSYPAYNWDIYGRCNCCRGKYGRVPHGLDLENYELPTDSGIDQDNADVVTGAPNQATGIMPEVSLEPAMESLDGLDYEEPPSETDPFIAALRGNGFTDQSKPVASAKEISPGDFLRYKVSDQSEFTYARVTMMGSERMQVGELVVFKRVFNAFEFEVYNPVEQSWWPVTYQL